MPGTQVRRTPLARRTTRGGRDSPEREFDQKTIELARVSRVMAGGKRMRFRACVAIGDRRGQVGVGVAKGADVSLAISKATAAARRRLVRIPLYEDTLPHEVRVKFKAATVLLKPAPRGTGIIAGGAVRSILELGGVPNVVSKMLGSKNKINNVKAAILALQALRPRAPRSPSPVASEAAAVTPPSDAV
jgi:small subunit ribosomal protein S5